MEELIKKIMTRFKQLTPENQQLFLWIAENQEFVEYMCQETMSTEKWDKNMEYALKKKDMMMVALLLYKKVYDERRRQENCQDEE